MSRRRGMGRRAAVQADVEGAVQREYTRQLQATATGRRMLAFKPKYGIAAYLLVAARDASISPLAVVRLMQFRTHGHHLQAKADQFRGDGRSTPCRCGSEREDPPHDSASVPAPPGVSPSPRQALCLDWSKPQSHPLVTSVSTAARSSPPQCGQARRRAMRGRTPWLTHQPGTGRSISVWRPRAGVERKPKAGKPPKPEVVTRQGFHTRSFSRQGEGDL